jgi:hypothetical protein
MVSVFYFWWTMPTTIVRTSFTDFFKCHINLSHCHSNDVMRMLLLRISVQDGHKIVFSLLKMTTNCLEKAKVVQNTEMMKYSTCLLNLIIVFVLCMFHVVRCKPLYENRTLKGSYHTIHALLAFWHYYWFTYIFIDKIHYYYRIKLQLV